MTKFTTFSSKDIRQLVLDHKDDNQELAVSGKYVLRWTENDDVDHVKRPRKSMPKVTSTTSIINDNGNKKKATGELYDIFVLSLIHI